MGEQAAQIVLRAYIMYKTGRYATLHSIQRLAEKCSTFDFEKVMEYGKILDRYYIATRFPDALASPAIPVAHGK